MKDRRVVITGLGAVTPVGNDVKTFWSGLKAGKSGIAPIQSMDTSDYRCKIAGEVTDFEPGRISTIPRTLDVPTGIPSSRSLLRGWHLATPQSTWRRSTDFASASWSGVASEG